MYLKLNFKHFKNLKHFKCSDERWLFTHDTIQNKLYNE